MKFRSLGVAAIALLLPFAAVACGGKDDNDSGSRPSVTEIKAELTKTVGADANAPGADEALDCLAKGLHESKLPNGVLRKIMKGDDAQVDKKNEDEYNKISEQIQTKCIGEAAAAG